MKLKLMMMAAVAALATVAQTKPLKVLMIGNSFSICVLQHMPQCAKAAGCQLDLASLYIGGCSFERHAKCIEAAEKDANAATHGLSWNYASCANKDDAAVAKAGRYVTSVDKKTGKEQKHFNANIPAALAADKWDIVTIQQASHFSWNPETYHPHVDKIIATIRKHAPQAKIYVQQTWSYCNADKRICDGKGGVGTWGFDQTGMYDRLTAAYNTLAKDNGFGIIPTGDAVQNFRAALPVKEVTDDVVGRVNKEGKGDTIHFNGRGTYLQGCVWTAELFGVDVTNLSYTPKGMDAQLAATIRAAAQKAVTARKAK